MKKILSGFAVIFSTLILMSAFAQPSFALQRFEDEDVSIVHKLPPQYVGWSLVAGSTTQTVPFYYKATAVVPGIGETLASAVVTAYATYSPLSSTNSVRIMWAPVQGASSYKLYKSVDNVSFYLADSSALLTYVDEGDALGAAYSAATPRGGNLTVENALTVSGAASITGALTVSGGISSKLETLTLAQMNLDVPAAAGIPIYASDSTSVTKVCVSSGTTAGAYTLITATATHCGS